MIYIERKFRISDQPKPVPLFYIAVYGDQVKIRAQSGTKLHPPVYERSLDA